MGWTVALTAVGTALSAAGAISEGRSRAAARESEAEAFERQAEQDRLDAEWVDVQTRQRRQQVETELDQVLAYNMAAGGYDPFSSPSFFAVEQASREAASRQVDAIMLEGAAGRRRALGSRTQSQIAAASSRDAARSARRAGLFNAARSLFTGGARIAQIR